MNFVCKLLILLIVPLHLTWVLLLSNDTTPASACFGTPMCSATPTGTATANPTGVANAALNATAMVAGAAIATQLRQVWLLVLLRLHR